MRPPDAANTSVPLLARGHVWHERLSPVRHRFTYATYFVVVPMRTLGRGCAGLARNRRGLLSFYDADHGLGGEDAVTWVDQLLVSQGITDATGPLWLQTYPRVLGYVFKPVSFWYAYRPDNSLAAVVAEVNNTFGERHCYVLHAPNLNGGPPSMADKVFHVSPFCSVAGYYEFRFHLQHCPASEPVPGAYMLAGVDLYQSTPPKNQCDAPATAIGVLRTTMSGQLIPLTRQTARRAFWGVPLMTLNVVARIHWQALQLVFKRVRHFSKPPRASNTVSVSTSSTTPMTPPAP